MSRANSVRFDESAIHGYYGQTGRSANELPLRTGSGMGSHPLTERSLSHRSDGRLSSSGQSHHSARTNSLGLETTSRMMSSSTVGSPLIPPPGLFLLGPVPSIIRCWLTTTYSNDSLQYAVICSGSYSSFIGYPVVRKFGLEDLVTREEGEQYMRIPLYLPEASIHQASSRASSPVAQLPAVTVRFLVRDVAPNDNSIQIVLGSDVLRSHNADILFSLDKVVMADDERNKVSIPLVRPENDAVFTSLRTASDAPHVDHTNTWRMDERPQINGDSSAGIIGQPKSVSPQPKPAPDLTAKASNEEPEDSRKLRPEPAEAPRYANSQQGLSGMSPVAADFQPGTPARTEPAGVWGSWRRDSKPDSSATATAKSRGRTMKVLRPSKPPSRVSTGAITPQTNYGTESIDTRASSPYQSSQPFPRMPSEDPRTSNKYPSNPIGGASAFGWLNSSQQPKRVVTNPELK